MATFPGWQDLIVCGVNPDSQGANPTYTHPCGFTDILVLIKHAMTDLILLSTLIVLIVLAVRAFELMMSQGKPAAMNKTKDSIFNIIKGYAIILVAWVVVYTVLNALVKPEYIFLTNPNG